MRIFSTSNTAFVIGNGTDSNAKPDAFKVMFNGDATESNGLTVSGDVLISSDARLKSNIVSLGPTPSKLLQIDGKYLWDERQSKDRCACSRDSRSIFPKLVTEDGNEMLAVNYQGLVSVLINALKEQQNEINILKDQEKKLERLDKLVAQLD